MKQAASRFPSSIPGGAYPETSQQSVQDAIKKECLLWWEDEKPPAKYTFNFETLIKPLLNQDSGKKCTKTCVGESKSKSKVLG